MPRGLRSYSYSHSYSHALAAAVARSCTTPTLSTWKQKKAHRKEYNAWVVHGADDESSVYPDLQRTSFYYSSSNNSNSSDSSIRLTESSTAAVVDQVRVEYELFRSIRGIFRGGNNINA